MKRKYFAYKSLLMTIVVILFTFTSCEYEEVPGNVKYPEQTIYMPAAYSGVYDISVANDPVAVPTNGVVTRYSIDHTANKLNIPLGVYRSGVTSKGEFSVDIVLNNDTVAQMINLGSLVSTEILPSNMISMPSSIKIIDGSDISRFDLSIDLDFIKSNVDKQYAIGVRISSSERKSNPKLSTTIVLIKSNAIKY
jgi:hypothetical protein